MHSYDIYSILIKKTFNINALIIFPAVKNNCNENAAHFTNHKNYTDLYTLITIF